MRSYGDPGAVRSNTRARGFTLIEGMVALLVVSIALVAMMGVIPVSFSQTQEDSYRIQAAAVGQQYLDAIRQSVQNNGNGSLPAAPTNLAIDAGDMIDGSGSSAASPGAFALQSNACPLVSGSLLRYDCAVTVSWSQGSASHSLVLETYVIHQ